MLLDRKRVLESCRDADVLLKTRCGGLLEIQFNGAKSITPVMKVSYLHRTVRDFLQSPATKEVLSRRTGGVETNAYKPNIAILKSYILQAGTCDPSSSTPDNQRLINQAFIYAGRADKDERISPSELIKLFDSFPRPASWDSALWVAILCDWQRYVQARIDIDETLLDSRSTESALHYALLPTENLRKFWMNARPSIVRFLLSLGADPNGFVDGQTLWQKALSHLIEKHEIDRWKEDNEFLGGWFSIVEIMLEYEADPYLTLRLYSRT